MGKLSPGIHWPVIKGKKRKVQVLRSGKWKFLKMPKKKSKSRASRPKTTKKKGGRSTTAKKGGRRGRRFTIPIAPIAGLAVGMAEPVSMLMAGNIPAATDKFVWHYLNMAGYPNPRWDASFSGWKKGLLPLVLGLLIHKFVGGRPLNVNQMLANANVPFIRI